jgi:hypothetical protein
MGIQVTVNRDDIPATWNPRLEVFDTESVCSIHCIRCGGEGKCIDTYEIPLLVVTVPGIGDVWSYVDDALVFDNKTINMGIRDALDAASIPYVRN